MFTYKYLLYRCEKKIVIFNDNKIDNFLNVIPLNKNVMTKN